MALGAKVYEDLQKAATEETKTEDKKDDKDDNIKDAEYEEK